MGGQTFRLGAHCTERPEVNQDKPDSKDLACASPSRSSTSTVCTANALGARRRLRRRSGISPLYDVKKSAREFLAAEWVLSAWMHLLGSFRIGGANRDRTDDLKLAKLALSQLSYGPKSKRRIAHQRKAIHRRPNTRSWWAWEDLNFRPHAYQARALTN